MNDHEAEQRREELIVRMGRAISQINGVYAKAEKLMGLNPYVSKVLYALLFGNGITQSEICDAYEMPKQTVNNILKELRVQGLLELVPVDTDRRNKEIVLTNRGRVFSAQVLGELTMLQIKGYVSQEPGKRFSLNIISQK